MVDFIPRRFRGRSAGELFAAARRRLALEASKLTDRFFDARYGTETAAVVENDHMHDVASHNLARGIRYEPTRAIPFRRAMRAARVPTDGVFVDLGCGKGRVCMLAAEHGFNTIIGIDYSPSLCALARKNLAIFKQRTGREFDADVRAMEATEYAFSGEETVVYLFNPFDGVIMGQVIEHVTTSLAQRPRALWLVYHNPVWRDVIERSQSFDAVGDWTAGGTCFAIYRSRRR